MMETYVVNEEIQLLLPKETMKNADTAKLTLKAASATKLFFVIK